MKIIGLDALVFGVDDVAASRQYLVDYGLKDAGDGRFEALDGTSIVIRAKDEADAIRLANDSAYGLSASVFTRDIARGLRVARQIRSGICHVNGPTVHDEPQMPFGGVGASGHGRFGGKAGIDQFTELRWITMETLPGHFPI